MRKALIIGIDHYEHLHPLTGCVNDAYAVKTALEHHADGTSNFKTPRLIVGTGPADIVERHEIKAAIRDLFADESEIALLYFAGHGYIEGTGGFLCSGNTLRGDEGLPLTEVMALASQSRAKNKVIILDSCHGGITGDRQIQQGVAELASGMTILTASTAEQYAFERKDGIVGGVFTNLLVDALNGAAANLVGDITPGSVYAHIDQSLGPWAGQRPVFKTNVREFVSLRRASPPIPLADLRALATLFPHPSHKFQLDPSFEPERLPPEMPEGIPPPDPDNTRVFAALQRCARVNLVRPVDAPHMWHAAMYSKSCELTVLGEHYQRLAVENML